MIIADIIVLIVIGIYTLLSFVRLTECAGTGRRGLAFAYLMLAVTGPVLIATKLMVMTGVIK